MYKIYLLIVSFFIVENGFGQNTTVIDSSNYYTFLDTKKSIYWLTREETAYVILYELEQAGYKQECDLFSILKIDTAYLMVPVICEKIKLGFLYEASHNYPPEKKNRYVRSLDFNYTGFDYIQRIENLNTDAKFLKVKKIPNNILIVKEDSYWYQEHISGQQTVTKALIIKILRQDIKDFIEKNLAN